MLRPNPQTGLLEDDGIGPPDLAPPTLQATPESTGGGAALPPASAPITIVAPPEESHRVETTGPQITKTVSPPGAVQAIADVKAAHGRESAAMGADIDQKLLQADRDAKLAEQQAELARQAQLQREAAEKAHQQQVAALAAERQKRRAEEERLSHPTTYWEDKSVPSRVLGALLMGVGTYASTLSRSPNTALDIFQKAEAEDRQRKIDKFKNAREFRELADHDLAGAHAALGNELARITQNEITRSNVLVKNAEALAKRTGLPHVLAQAQQFKAVREAENAEKEARLEQHDSQTIQSGRTTTSDVVNVNKGKNAQGDLSVQDLEGKTVAVGRSKEEAKELHDKRASAVGGIRAAEQLSAEIEKGKLWPLIQAGEDNTRKVIIGRMLEAKKAVTGALTKDDRADAEGKLNTAWNKGPDEVKRTIGVWKDSLKADYDTEIDSKAVRQQVPGSAPAADKPKVTRAEATSALAKVNKLLKELPKGSPDRGRAEALRKRIIEEGDAAR